jgi:hypothetical protein
VRLETGRERNRDFGPRRRPETQSRERTQPRPLTPAIPPRTNGRSGDAARNILALQRTVGNRVVASYLAERGPAIDAAKTSDAGDVLSTAIGSFDTQASIFSVDRYVLKATIPRRETQSLEPAGGSSRAQRDDAMPGKEEDPTETLGPAQSDVAAAVAAPATAASSSEATEASGEGEGAATADNGPAAGAGATVTLPDVVAPPDYVELGKSDTVAGNFGYSGSITKGGAEPSGFGITRSFNASLTGVTNTHAPGAYTIQATVNHPITFQIRSGTGPDGQVDISSESAAAITAANYRSIATDLTPDMSDLNGRPPRAHFWAEDLTDRHERVHCADDQGNAPGVITQFSTWLGTQTASSAGDVSNLLATFPNRFASGLLAALSTEAGERHAYGDGAPSYLARANAVTAKGGRGEYH